MPELPEVETVKRSLEKLITGLTIINVDVLMPKIIKSHTAQDFKKLLMGSEIKKLGRRGKYLLVYLSANKVLVIHLRMTGRLVLLKDNAELPKYTHVIFYLENDKRLIFADMRQFGRIDLLPEEELANMPGLKKLGPEPLEKKFNPEYLKKELKRRRTKIKALLLDQTFVAGLGNIYADEALHLAKVHPERPARDLTAEEIVNLYNAIVTVLRQGIKNRGTSFSDYVDGEGNTGSNQNMLKVYRREGKPCHCCGSIIKRKKVAGRSSCFCPQCQQL
ncbi:formamidopyrimidine-DNA glycosylase [Desulfohalotomaculum tongense]|uniref:bifunctional DNA-formamidopyrimidine glycosylase/DNA-(apurinic or apyrimidinic site) lyase n=1 Tax=Desulforadius tongensis TaxID=1216062 RepID=UPI001957654A|nr:bifunctional DNA-formamidopyrimidine glycosylase/DNA-(apurinic or apyrimidinic site) lyase [Desulforadius tongensis]MBM7855050.1 formamidopyrimidine-DNA glycosylase [Desulforadius tongensis]